MRREQLEYVQHRQSQCEFVPLMAGFFRDSTQLDKGCKLLYIAVLYQFGKPLTPNPSPRTGEGSRTLCQIH
jgi:hypothetical protein